MFRHRLSALSAMSPVPGLLLVVGLLAVSWTVVFAAGGTRTAWPHLFYLPVVAAVIPFGLRGGIATGLAATLLCGPLMPLSVDPWVAQSPENWLVRGLFFLIVGVLAGTAVRAATAGLERDLTRHLTAELGRAVDDGDEPVDVVLLQEVVDEQRFEIVFQPIYALDDGRLVGAEALTRFPDATPTRSPDVWFAQAAEVGLGIDLELATARAALQAASDLPDSVMLSLNVSPACVMDPRLGQLLAQHADRRLVVELTEHAVVDDYAGLTARLHALRGRGVQVAVDDAGAGFASLQHVVRLTPDIIKLDISLTQHVRNDPVRRALAAALVQFAEQTGSTLVAEGIETVADLTIWQNLGAHAAQGFLLARPASAPVPLDPCRRVSQSRTSRFEPSDLVQADH